MGVKYDPASRKWSVSYEKTDHKTDNPTSYAWDLSSDNARLATQRTAFGNFITINQLNGGMGGLQQIIPTSTTNKSKKEIEGIISNLENFVNTGVVTLADGRTMNYSRLLGGPAASFKDSGKAYIDEWKNRLNTIDLAEKINTENAQLNQQNTTKNKAYDQTVAIASSTKGGDYVAQRDQIKNLPGLTESDKKIAEDYFKAFYRTEKLQKYGEEFLKKPPYGEFDHEYYKALNPALASKWNEAVTKDDIDITERYGERNFYWKDYTDVGAAKGLRANKAEAAQKAIEYKEAPPTDAELQQVRDKQLGMVDTDAQTELEEQFGKQIGEQTKEDLLRFGALRQNVLKDTIAEMKKAKLKEQELSLYKGLPGYGEIFDVNKTLADSILGDTGVGGVLSYLGKDPQESLTKQLQGVTGVNNNVVYNWQQWFDNALKDKYGKEVELGYTNAEGAEEKIKVDGEFAKSFIDTYLSPRFNTSKSMDEFIDYIDVKENEQNPFQTQDAVSAAKMVAESRARKYLDSLKTTTARGFDSDFYFNPANNKATDEENARQAKEVSDDWEAAKKGDPEWQKQAYRFGIDINDKAAFARMHYQVKGQFKNFDPAEDILTAKKVSDYIYKDILPAVSQEMLNQKTIFGQFITPEEFADSMLEGVDPSNKPEWEKVLKQYGMDTFTGTVQDLKMYIQDVIRSGNAKDIREQIKFLNERKERPTQELLGITYIERPSDLTAKEITGQTELYKTFQEAGFKGSEDEFYTRFFPDLDRSEQIALTKAGSGGKFELQGLDLSDPLSSLGTVESFFGSDEDTSKTTSSEDEDTSTSSYFRLGDDEDEYTKSKSGQGFLDEFTSMFKGFG